MFHFEVSIGLILIFGQNGKLFIDILKDKHVIEECASHCGHREASISMCCAPALGNYGLHDCGDPALWAHSFSIDALTGDRW